MRITLLALGVALTIANQKTVAATNPPKPIIVGYVFPQDDALQPGAIKDQNLTRINYAFANIANGRMVPGFRQDAKNFASLTTLRQQNPSLTILVSVGGWLWSTHFSDIALTPQSRATFVQSALDFIKRYNLDGLDIDWEYPGMVGSGHPFRPQDKQNFTLLLQDLRKQFNLETAQTHRKLYLTIAVGASDEYIAHTEMSKVQQYVDTINLMAYDFYEPASDKLTGNHAPLFTNPADPKKVSANTSIQALQQAGVPSSKILLGVPFYGQIWGNVPARNNGLFQPGKPIPNAYAPYSLIANTMLDHGFTRYWDSSASVPYLYSPLKKTFVSYEDPQSLAVKADYVLKHQLAGIMFWDYTGDPTGRLLQSIHESFNKPHQGSN